MSLGGFHRHRRLAGALALAGMAFYAVLLPWHTVSQTTIQLAQSDVATFLQPPCHQSAAMAGQNSKSHSKPQTHCPICNGFAALHLVVSAPTNVLTVRVATGDLLLPATEDDPADAAVPRRKAAGLPPPPPSSDCSHGSGGLLA
jgi:hypothetical protein